MEEDTCEDFPLSDILVTQVEMEDLAECIDVAGEDSHRFALFQKELVELLCIRKWLRF